MTDVAVPEPFDCQREPMLDRLRASEARLRAIFEHAGIGIGIVDVDSGRIVLCNAALATMLGYRADELAALTVEAISEPQDYQADHAQWASLMAGEKDRYQMEKRFLRADGSTMFGKMTVSIVREEDRKPRSSSGWWRTLAR